MCTCFSIKYLSKYALNVDASWIEGILPSDLATLVPQRLGRETLLVVINCKDLGHFRDDK